MISHYYNCIQKKGFKPPKVGNKYSQNLLICFYFNYLSLPPPQISPGVSGKTLAQHNLESEIVLGSAGLPLASSNSSPPRSCNLYALPPPLPWTFCGNHGQTTRSNNCSFSLYCMCFQLTVNHLLLLKFSVTLLYLILLCCDTMFYYVPMQ